MLDHAGQGTRGALIERAQAPPIVGHIAIAATRIPSTIASMPKRAVPLTLAAVLPRFAGLPISLNCDTGFNDTSPGIGCVARHWQPRHRSGFDRSAGA
jgi:hypothetical protein